MNKTAKYITENRELVGAAIMKNGNLNSKLV
jgi:hypothetical protein